MPTLQKNSNQEEDNQKIWMQTIADWLKLKHNLLYRYVEKKYRDDDLEDLFAEVRVRMLESAVSNTPENVRVTNAYLFTSFKNTLVDIVRARYGRPRLRFFVKDLISQPERKDKAGTYHQIYFDYILRGYERNELIARYKNSLTYEEISTFVSAINRYPVHRRPEYLNINDIEADGGLDGGDIYPPPDENYVFEDANDYLTNIIKTNVAELSDIEKMILKLTYFNNVPLKEIAEIVNMPPHTVRRKRQRGLDKIRSYLEKNNIYFDDVN